ncbi:MAG TPA: alpha/beta fold hydrolase [Gemmatimonadaceae bacterium]
MDIIRTASFKVWEAPERAYLFARWSYEPAERALIFVHGLASSWDVWVPFRHAIEQPEMARTDVFWFDYPSLGTTVQRATLRFREAVNGLIDGDSSAFGHRTFPSTRPTPSYKTIDIVAHSLGAVVARGGLAERTNHVAGKRDLAAPPDWKVEQLLLAPALLGSKLPWLMKYVGTESFFSALQLVRRGGFSAIMDLKEGSNHLKGLESQVNNRLGKTPVAANACGLYVEHTSHGSDDHVVIQGNYAQDENYELTAGNHFTIVRAPSQLAHDFVLGKDP